MTAAGKPLSDAAKAKRAATAENNRRQREAPLLVATGVLEPTTLGEQAQRLQRDAARAAEHCGTIVSAAVRGLDWLHERRLARMVLERVGPEIFAALEGYAQATYPSVTYWAAFWFDVLTGKRVVFAWRQCFDPAKVTRWNSDGRYAVEAGVYQADPPWFTREELHRLFPPNRWGEKPQQPDDGGLWERVSQAITRGKR